MPVKRKNECQFKAKAQYFLFVELLVQVVIFIVCRKPDKIFCKNYFS